MMRSLRFRLLAVVALVSAVAVITVVLVSRQAVQTEFGRFEMSTRAVAFEDAAEALRTWVHAGGDPGEAGALLRRFDRPGHRALVLVDSLGQTLAFSSPKMKDARVSILPGGRIEISHERIEGKARSMQRAVIIGAPHAPIGAGPGAPPAMLYAVPLLESEGGPAAPFVRSVNRWMIGAVAAAGLLSLIVMWLLSRRIVGPVEALTTAARRMEGGDWGARVAVRSRDEIGDLSHAFNAMAESLARNETLRRQLVSDVAHELRTPLTNLRAQLEAIEDGIVPADAAALRSLHEETLLLARLVEDLQELSLAEAGRLRLDRAPIAPSEAIEAVATAFRAQAESRGVAIRVSPSDAPAVLADRARLAQILRNLVGNAVTHTPDGGELTLSAAPDAAGGGVRFDVRDTGEGIAPEHLPHLFDRFYRADASRTRATGGAGLGLAIVKHLVEAHGGSVAVASEPGRGTTVSFTIPAATP
ncbi:MAG TPA: ATP-binding protein [Candidatus Eisenbacteria bacterium]|nr:ATP-binding protein [Candidatus Eisenbacteria bacterium]